MGGPHAHLQKAVSDRYKDVDFSVPQAVRDNLKRGLQLHEEGHSGDGLQPETVAWARRLAGGENISPEKARKMRAWLARHETDRKPNWAEEKTPGYVAWMLWGGDDAVGWSGKLVEQMEARDRDAVSKAAETWLYDDVRAAWVYVVPEVAGSGGAQATSLDEHLAGLYLAASAEPSPTQAPTAEQRVAKRAAALSVVKGTWASTSHAGQVLPLYEAPIDVARAVSDMPLTETYPDPEAVGGWLGVIEPEDDGWIAFVAVDGRTLLWTQRNDSGGVVGVPYATYRLDLATTPISEALSKSMRPIMKFRVRVLGEDATIPVAKFADGAAKPKRRIVYGVVLEPEPCDGQGDSQAHTYDAEFVRDACHYYSQFRLLNAPHKSAPIDTSRARVVELYIAPVDFVLDTPRGPQNVKKGSWVMGTEILDDALWQKVERGEWNAYSVEGFARSEPINDADWNRPRHGRVDTMLNQTRPGSSIVSRMMSPIAA
jgi:hypothetical protein